MKKAFFIFLMGVILHLACDCGMEEWFDEVEGQRYNRETEQFEKKNSDGEWVPDDERNKDRG